MLLDSDRFNAVNALDAWGASALYVAAENGHKDVVKALLRSLRFTLAPQHEWLECFSALHVAAWKGYLEVAKVLLSDSRFPTATVNAQNRYGGTALHTAARFGHYGVVDVLLRHRRFRSADALDCMGSSALHTAAHSGHDSAVQSLLQSGPVSCMASPNTSGLTALHLAAVQGHEGVTRALLGCSQFPDSAINAVTSGDGATALHLAVRFKHLAVVQVLLQSPRFHAACSATQIECHTALHVAIATGCNSQMVGALLNAKKLKSEAVNAADRSGRTALHIAAERGAVAAAKLLLQSRKFTVPAASSHRSGTALQIASQHGSQDMVELLQRWI